MARLKSKTMRKPWTQMTTEELAEATKEFDKPLPPGSTRPLSKAKRAEFERMQRAPYRSVYVQVSTGKTKAIKVEMDEELLRRSTEYAERHEMSLSEFINRSVRGTLIAVG